MGSSQRVLVVFEFRSVHSDSDFGLETFYCFIYSNYWAGEGEGLVLKKEVEVDVEMQNIVSSEGFK